MMSSAAGELPGGQANGGTENGSGGTSSGGTDNGTGGSDVGGSETGGTDTGGTDTGGAAAADGTGGSVGGGGKGGGGGGGRGGMGGSSGGNAGAGGKGGNGGSGGSGGSGSCSATCPDGKPKLSGGSCVDPPSCQGLAANCGPTGNESCCTSPVVCGGTFNRTSGDGTHNDATHKATVSNFRLDKYEITVGRFKKFVASYTQNMISAGAGKNPNNTNGPSDPGGADTGWDTAWNTKLPADKVALATKPQSLDGRCNNWTYAGAEDRLPMNCLSWYEAQAFCIWDGGRLPTDAEWGYAAAGGSEQRLPLPWSGGAPAGTDSKRAIYGCYYPDKSGTCDKGLGNIAPVGSTVNGNARWGQADMAGNLWEWVQDYWGGALPAASTDWAYLGGGANRLSWGGSYPNSATFLGYRGNGQAENQPDDLGARCARQP